MGRCCKMWKKKFAFWNVIFFCSKFPNSMRKPIKKILHFKLLTLQIVKFEMSEYSKTTFLSILVFWKYHLDNQGLAAQNIKIFCLILSYSDSYKRSGSFLLQHLQPLSLYRYIYIMCQQELIVVACFYVKNI